MTAPRTTRRKPGLTPQQLRIVYLLAHGYSTEDIASTLRIGVDTIRTHVRDALVRVGAGSRAHLVGMAYQRGWIDVEEGGPT